jgi:hypothetical protein
LGVLVFFRNKNKTNHEADRVVVCGKTRMTTRKKRRGNEPSSAAVVVGWDDNVSHFSRRRYHFRPLYQQPAASSFLFFVGRLSPSVFIIPGGSSGQQKSTPWYTDRKTLFDMDNNNGQGGGSSIHMAARWEKIILEIHGRFADTQSQMHQDSPTTASVALRRGVSIPDRDQNGWTTTDRCLVQPSAYKVSLHDFGAGCLVNLLLFSFCFSSFSRPHSKTNNKTTNYGVCGTVMAPPTTTTATATTTTTHPRSKSSSRILWRTPPQYPDLDHHQVLSTSRPRDDINNKEGEEECDVDDNNSGGVDEFLYHPKMMMMMMRDLRTSKDNDNEEEKEC